MRHLPAARRGAARTACRSPGPSAAPRPPSRGRSLRAAGLQFIESCVHRPATGAVRWAARRASSTPVPAGTRRSPWVRRSRRGAVDSVCSRLFNLSNT
ncbi:MAG: hypothetical protein MZV63_33410 [Marinilabiliales bacterium]|nr:hypothetical protein [Marinilabiliales bacterium]